MNSWSDSFWASRFIVCAAIVLPLWAACGGPGGGGSGGGASRQAETSPEVALRNNGIVRQKQCVTCHTIGLQGGTVGPTLNQVALRRDADWLRTWLKDPNEIKPGTRMPNFQFNDKEIEDLVGLLTQMRRPVDGPAIVARLGTSEAAGEELFAAYDCYACHRIGNRGRFIGPDLTWVGHRRPQDWEHRWLSDPPGFKPGTFMPKFPLTEPEISSLTTYLHGLKGERNAQSRQWEEGVSLFLDSPKRDRGEKVYLRLACWSCHGDPLRGGIRRNDNMAPNEEIGAMSDVLAGIDDVALARTIRQGSVPRSLDETGPTPLGCPSYAAALNAEEMQDLLAYLKTLAPKKSKFRFN